MDLIGGNMMFCSFVMRVRVIINSLYVPIYLFAIIWKYVSFLLIYSFFSFINISFFPLCLPSSLYFLYIPYIYLFTLPRPIYTRLIDLINKNTTIIPFSTPLETPSQFISGYYDYLLLQWLSYFPPQHPRLISILMSQRDPLTVVPNPSDRWCCNYLMLQSPNYKYYTD